MKWTNSATCNIVKMLSYKDLRRGMHLAMYFCEDGMPVFLNAAVVTRSCCHNAIWLAQQTDTKRY